MSAALLATPPLRLVQDERDPSSPTDDAAQAELGQLRAEVERLRHASDLLNVHLVRLDEELRLAARLQQDFLPKSLPQVGNVQFHALWRPAGHVSGDFYDVFRLDEAHVGFYIADAVGHGMPAALLTMFIKQALATKQIGPGGYRILSAAETMTRLNETLLDQSLSAATFATAIYGTINVHTNELTLARAGHPLPLVLHRDGTIDTIDSNGGLLGVFAAETFEQVTLQLVPGDRLLLYTDGVEVAYPVDDATGPQRWREEVEARRMLPAGQLVRSLEQGIESDPKCPPRRDDLTLLVMEIA